MTLFDLTYPLGPCTPVFPGDEPVSVRVVSDCARGDTCTARRLELGSHSGTHVDAPAHLIAGGLTVDALPLSLWIGPALLADLGGLDAGALEGVARLLLSDVAEGLSLEQAAVIAGAGVRLLGIDGPSLDPVTSADLPVHRLLLGAGIALVENLRLEGVPQGRGTLYCLPLPVEGGDGAPCRVLWEGV
ncbi:MAG: cyclase family protein [Deltaproteobacteria bacterium]|nr:cyclase family protein [Deltaproteobacteria bacterium]